MMILLTLALGLSSLSFLGLIILSTIIGKKAQNHFKKTIDNAMQFQNIHEHIIRFDFKKSSMS